MRDHSMRRILIPVMALALAGCQELAVTNTNLPEAI